MAGGIYDESGVFIPHANRDRPTTGTTEQRILVDRLTRMISQVEVLLLNQMHPARAILYKGRLEGMKDAMALLHQHFYGTDPKTFDWGE